MEFFRIRRDIPFMRHALVLNIVSFITFAAAVFFLATRGLNLSIEFKGGTLLEVRYAQSADIDRTRSSVEALGYGEVQVQTFGSSRDVMIRLPLSTKVKQTEVAARVFEALCKSEGGAMGTRQYLTSQGEQVSRVACTTASGQEPLMLTRTEAVGASVGAELYQNGAWALLSTVLGIAAYLTLRFEWKFALAGIIANLHDVVIILGFFAFFQWEFSLAVLAAVLAVLGYSVNESVVIFDRIRESFRKFRKLNTQQVIDHAITSTTSRTIITHGCTEMMVLSMLIFGGPTLHFFAVALTIGILFGIYSSIFVAAGIAMWLGVKRDELIKPQVDKERDPNDPNAGAVV
jgi:preprotein translocase subunit SecF